MAVGIVVDSGASLPDEGAAARLVLAPMGIHTRAGEFEDGAIDRAALLSELPFGVSTSAPTPAVYLRAIEAAEDGAGVVVLTVAEALSASFNAARLAVNVAGEHHQIALVDTGTATVGEGLVALAAAELAHAGATLPEVAAHARHVAARVRLVARVKSLDQLVRGGRVAPVAARAAKLAGLQAMFELAQGQIRRLRPAFSSEVACRRMLEALGSTRSHSSALHVAILHAGEPTLASELLGEVLRAFEPVSAFTAELSTVMLAHTGPEVLGVAWWDELSLT